MADFRFQFGLPDEERRRSRAIGLGSQPNQGSVMDRIVQVESGGNARAKNPKSSATGLGQFIESTWLETIAEARPDIVKGRSRNEILELRNDPELSREMTAHYEAKNARYLEARGLPATPGTKYLAHFLGPEGAATVLRAPAGTPVSKLLPGRAIAANKSILAGKTADEVVAWAQRKMGDAASVPSGPTAPAAGPDPVEQAFAELEAAEPGRYQVIAEDEYDDWRARWRDENLATFGESIGRGVDQAQGMGFGALEAAGEAINSDFITGLGREGRERNDAELAAGKARSQFADIEGAEDFGQWAKEVIGEQIPIMAPSLAGSVTGALSGALIAGPLGATVGGILGAFVPSFVLGTGETQAAIKEKDPNTVAPGHAFLGGTAIGALDAIVPGKIGGSLVSRFGGRAAEEIAQRALSKPVSPNMLVRGARGAAESMVTEGVTEALQEAISEVVAAHATGQPVDTEGLPGQMLEAGAAGALVGGVMGGAGGAIRKPSEAQPQPQQQQSEQAAEAPAEVPAAPAPAAPAPQALPVRPEGPVGRAVGKAPAIEPEVAQVALLRGAGYSDDDILDMNAAERAAEAEQALEQGVTPGSTEPLVRATQEAVEAPEAPDGQSPAPIEQGQQAAPLVSGDGTRAAPAAVNTAEDLAAATQHVATDPTDAQKEAGNYAKGHIRLQGLDITIENPKGSERSGKDADGKPWSVKMPAAYGYVKRTEGADGDQVDVYVGDEVDAPRVFVVDQVDADTGRFDEHKAMLGYASGDDARRAYVAGFSDGRGEARIGAITAMSVDEFRSWAKEGDTSKPLAQKPVAAPNTRTAPTSSAKKPVTFMLRAAGGVDPDSPLAGELRHMGITPTAAPGLFRKGGRTAVDNFVAAEHPLFANDAGDDGYIPAETILEALRDEYFGEPRQTPEQEAAQAAERAAEQQAEARAEIAAAADEFGLERHKEEIIDRAVSLYGEGVSVEDALERAVMSLDDEITTEADRADYEAEDIPFDVSDSRAAEEPVEALPQARAAAGSGGGEGPAVQEVRPGAVTAQDPRSETGADGRPQLIIPGAEPISDSNLAQRRADQPLKPKLPQKAADDGLFGDDSRQGDLVDLARKPAEPRRDEAQQQVNQVVRSKEWKQVFGSTTNVNAETEHYAHPESPVAHDRVQGWLDAKAGKDPRRPRDPGPDVRENGFNPIEPYLEGYIGGREGRAIVVRATEAVAEWERLTGGQKVRADDADETVTIRLSREGPWDFNDTYPAVADDTRAALEKEGRWPFEESFPLEEQVAATFNESINELQELVATLQDLSEAQKKADAGEGKPPRKMTHKEWAAQIKKERQNASASLVDIRGTYVDLFGEAAAEAMLDEAVARERQQRASAPGPRVPAGPETIGGFSVGEMVDVPNRTIGRSEILRFFEQDNPVGRLQKAEIRGADGKTLDVVLSELRKVEDAPKTPEQAIRDGELPIEDDRDRQRRENLAKLEAAKAYGADNKLVTADRAEELRARLKAKLNNLNAGIDPEIIAIGTELTVFHIEAGARRFMDVAAALARDLDMDLARLRPYLRSWYNGARDMMEDGGLGVAGMDDAQSVRDALADIDVIVQRASAETAAPPSANVAAGENTNEPTDLDGARALEGAPSEEVRRAPEDRQAGQRAAEGGRGNDSRDEGSRGAGLQDARGLADGAGEVPLSAGRDGGSGGRPAQPVRDAGTGSRGTSQQRAAGDRRDLASAATPAGQRATNFTITDADAIGEGGAKTKFRQNVDAVRLLRELEETRRAATRDQQAVLAKFLGWGGLRNAFPREDGSVAKGWEKEAAELRELLSDAEYEAAESSTRNAHYTSAEVVGAIWSAVERLGFAGGRVLEPSVGVGNFLGLMPAQLRPQAQITGVELDHITGDIAKHLYPDANVKAPIGFQDFAVPDNYFDLAIGNPPFGSERIYDSQRKAISKFSIHNFFFAKSLEAVRPGGVVSMVVSNFLMDAGRQNARAWLAERADLVAAIRLPNNAFQANAGTEVTTDIVILRKRAEGEQPSGESWLKVEDFTDAEGRTVPLNEYFVRHPEQMLGEFGAYGEMYRGETAALIAREGQNTAELLAEAVARLPRNIMPAPGSTVVPETVTVPVDVSTTPVGAMFLDRDGTIMRGLDDVMAETRAEPVETASPKAKQRITGMIRVRDAFANLRKAQLDERADDAEIATLRKKLNKVYDTFVAKNGPINLDANKRLFREDPTWPQISALEDSFDRGISAAVAKSTGETPREPSAVKAPIFSRRTQSPYRPPSSASSAKDALATTLGETGRVDMEMMSRLYGKPEAAIIEELGELIFRNPIGGYETRDHYLSGNVKQKLAIAEDAVLADKQFVRNIEALKAAIPEDIEAIDIDVKPGAPWLPAKHVAAFADHITGTDGTVAHYVAAVAKWSIRPKGHSQAAQTKWGTGRVSVEEVLVAAANGRTIVVRDQHSDGSSSVNQAETDAAAEKVTRVTEEWRKWVWQDDARRTELHRLYNDSFNTDRLRTFDGSHLTLPGKVSDDIIALRPHQKSAVWRIVQSETTLLDHVVGAGKTFAAIAGTMELRRMGLAKKPMLVVPNHLVGQWAADFVKLYPGARILAATKKDFEKEARKRLFARVATGDWDAVIVAHSSFGRIMVDPEFEADFIRQQIDDIQDSLKALREATGEKKSRNVSQLTKQRDTLAEKLKALLDSHNKDENITFEEMGVDALIVDEAHEFKNLQFSTSMQRVMGLGNQKGSQKAFDLYVKTQSVLKRTGGRNIVFLTGTPVSNTMAEMYTMQRYLDGKTLRAQGLSHFDAWASMFGQVVTDWELSPAGTYKLSSRFSKFVNMPELMQRYRSFADVITNEDIKRQLAEQGKTLPLPKVKGGKPENVVVERSRDQAVYVGEPDENGRYPEGSLVWRAENLPKKPQFGEDNMLKIMSDARKAALDMRLIDPSYPDRPGSKVHQAADRMVELYRQWDDKKGTQLVFIDLSTPKGASAKEAAALRSLMEKAEAGDEAAQEKVAAMSPDEFLVLEAGEFSVYDDLRQKLISRGIPDNEIAFIHDANTELRKEELFGKVRSGRVRFLFGSTAKMGAGMNVQNRLVALHHLDAPWRPSDLEQREGRIIRQGNELYAADPDGFEVEINRYATKNTLDARMWQTIEGKARFIEQLRKGDAVGREVEDVAGQAANAAEMKAAASGNPLILEEMDLRQSLRKLEGARAEHNREQYRVRDLIGMNRSRVERLNALEPPVKADAERAGKLGDFAVKIGDATIDKHKEVGEAVIARAKALLKAGKDTDDFGSFGEFSLRLDYLGAEETTFTVQKDDGSYGEATATRHPFVVEILGDRAYQVDIRDIGSVDPTGLARRLDATARKLASKPAALARDLEQTRKEITDLEGQIREWPDGAKLEEMKTRHREVLAALQPKKNEQPAQAQGTDTAAAASSAGSSVPTAPLRSLGLPAKSATRSVLRDQLEALTGHADYEAAKGGDRDAAIRLITDIVPAEFAADTGARFGRTAIYVAPHAIERSGRNKIPQTLADYLSAVTGADVDSEIVQTSKAHHTGARPLDRLLGRPLFGGAVRKGGRYVLVDDVTVMGGTLAELANYIRTGGGEVIGVVTLVNRSRSGLKPAPKQHVRLIEERYGELVRQDFGIEPAALTGDEALVILAARDADDLRNRVVKARQERDERLRASGLRPSEAEPGGIRPPTGTADQGPPRGGPSDSGAARSAPTIKIEREVQARLEEQLTAIVRSVAGGEVNISLEPTIDLESAGDERYKADMARYDEAGGRRGRTAGGTMRIQDNGEAFVRLATADPNFDPLDSAFHEAYHVAEGQLMTEAEFAVVTRPDQARRIAAFAAKALGNPAAIGALPTYEQRAIAFQRYAARRDEGLPISRIPLPRPLVLFYEKLRRIVSEMRRTLTGHGFTRFEDIFEDVYQGNLAGRSRGFRDIIAMGSTVLREVSLGRTEASAESAAFDAPSDNARIRDFLTRRISARLGAIMPSETRLRTVWQDRFLQVKRYQEAIAKQGRPINEAQDAYLAESLYYGRAGERLHELRLETIDPLVEAMRAADITAPELDEYLYALHAPERNEALREINPDIESPSGMSDAKAAEIVARIEADDRAAAFKQLAGQVHRLNTVARNRLLAAGLISEETHTEWAEKYAAYVPLRGFEGDPEGEAEAIRSGRGFDIRGPEAKQALGRRSLADSPLAYSILQAEQAILRAEKNRVLKALLKLVQAHPNKEVWQVNRVEKRRRRNQTTGLVETYTVPPAALANDPRVFVVKQGGTQAYITLHDERLARAFRQLGSENMHIIMRAMSAVTRTLARLSTAWNPEFVVSNAFRDLQTALVHLSAEETGKLKRNVLRDYFKAGRGMYGYAQGKRATEWQRHAHEFAEAGGKISFFDFSNIESQKRAIEGALTRGKAKRAFRAAFDLIENVNSAVENAVRLSTYVNLRRAGKTKAEAASVARELTVNFNRKGEIGLGLNALYMFANAGIQGTARMAVALKRSQKVRLIGLGMIGFGILLDQLNYFGSGDDEDELNRWDKIEAWKKERNLVIMLPKGAPIDNISVPLPYGWNVPLVIGQQISAAGRGGASIEEAAGNIIGALIGSFMPVDPGGSFVQWISPTIADPFVQIGENKDWKGSPIAPMRFPGDLSPEAGRHWKSTHPAAIELAHALNRLTGGNDFRSGAIDVSPEHIEHLTEFFTGGAGAFVVRSSKTIKGLTDGEIMLHEVPFARRVAGTTNDYANRNLYYDLRQRVDAFEAEWEGLRKAGRRAEAASAAKQQATERAVLPTFKAVEKQLRALRKRKKVIEAMPRLSEERRKAQLEAIDKRMDAAMLRARRAWARAAD